MTRKRRIHDFLLNGITYVASLLSVLVLVGIFSFVIVRGKDTLSLDMLKSNYWSENYLLGFSKTESGIYVNPGNLDSGDVFNESYGIAVRNDKNHEGKKTVIVTYIDDKSPFNETYNLTAGPQFEKHQVMHRGDAIERITMRDSNGNRMISGHVAGDDAKSLSLKLDQAQRLESIYFKTQSGGIWGSILATLLLIATSLLFALPLGIGAALYLTEIAPDTAMTRMLESSIEMLAGVPSIIFGLLGIAVLFPITAFFNVSGLSILLGGMTMAIILLPVIIRSVKESLLVVPDGLRSASLSLGGTQTQTIFKVVLPSALPGILSAVLLSVSRIIGESAALIYTMGTFVNDAPGLTQGGTSLAVHIWSVMSQEQPNFELASAISIVILALVLILNLTVKYISKQLQKRMGY
ncbi:phosphate ABC transporter permease PstA [Erysipelothrix amsterdamensis]|uniref:Phosphate transport system permease protein PstA n=1 Tax=Erysipelothrix amsterdamensis TaxID=2929157 RepID=A0AAU9VJQ3_9FIRM|nr:phosphate ABC transporter permease PstA [Erysipelothrix sp. A18Y020d]CAH2762754.1 phosphate ABC transporter permease PstA [Erysipelothrix sp. A18Y020d]